jgi:hypothetical protein
MGDPTRTDTPTPQTPDSATRAAEALGGRVQEVGNQSTALSSRIGKLLEPRSGRKPPPKTLVDDTLREIESQVQALELAAREIDRTITALENSEQP